MAVIGDVAMKILWVINIPLPELCPLLGIPVPAVGGWLSSLACPLSEAPDVELGIAVPTANGNGRREHRVGRIRFFQFPANPSYTRYSAAQESALRLICKSFHPDVVHIHGTEHPHALAAANAAEINRVVVSIQGLISVYARYYYGGISPVELLKNITIRDILRRDTFFLQRSRMWKRAMFEIELLKKARHAIGRTDWDAAHALAINPELQYHHGDEVLRPSFFSRILEDGRENRAFDFGPTVTISDQRAPFCIAGLCDITEEISGFKDQYHRKFHTRIQLSAAERIWEIFEPSYRKI